jgi:hypothetical protein
MGEVVGGPLDRVGDAEFGGERGAGAVFGAGFLGREKSVDQAEFGVRPGGPDGRKGGDEAADAFRGQQEAVATDDRGVAGGI